MSSNCSKGAIGLAEGLSAWWGRCSSVKHVNSKIQKSTAAIHSLNLWLKNAPLLDSVVVVVVVVVVDHLRRKAVRTASSYQE